MTTEEQKEVNRILRQKANISKKFKIRQQFRERIQRMTEIYIDICDDEWKEVSKKDYIKFLYDDETIKWKD